MVDITRLRKNAEKKTLSISSAEIRHGDVSATTSQELFNLPANCLIVDAGVVVEVAGQGGLTVDFGFDGLAELGDDLALSSTGYVDTPFDVTTLVLADGTPNTLTSGTVAKTPRLLTGTGKTVTAKFSADPSAGIFHFIVEYIEYTLGNGNLTVLGDGT